MLTDHPKIDRLSGLLQRFVLRAQTLHTGPLRALASYGHQGQGGCLHLLRRGTVVLRHGEHGALQPITEPSLLYFPRTQPHWLEPQGPVPAELISVAVDLGSCDDNPLLRALPAVLLHPLAQLPQLAPALDLMSAESAAARCGHGAVLDRVAEALVIQLLRFAIEQRLVDSGLLCGLSDPRLVRVLAAVHAAPDQPWTLPRMASLAHMSRARFAEHFARVMGEPPGDYLTGWRMGLARTLLAQGMPLKKVASEVGYASGSAFTRAFSRRTGCSPTQWMHHRAARSTEASTANPALAPFSLYSSLVPEHSA
jgi:AraC-like DNA-binding protein